MQADERKDSEVSFLLAAVAYYEQLGVKTKRQITGNGSAYRSQLFAKTSQVLGIKHTFAQPCGPKPTARPSASFIPTSAHGPLASPGSTAPSVRRLSAFLRNSNYERPHCVLAHKPSAFRLCGSYATRR